MLFQLPEDWSIPPDEPVVSGHLEARHDEWGPHVYLRWSRGGQIAVKDLDFMAFKDAVGRGTYRPEPSSEQDGWIRFEIQEANPRSHVEGWRPKVLHIPKAVWDRFVDDIKGGVFTNLPHYWVGRPRRQSNGSHKEQPEASSATAMPVSDEGIGADQPPERP
jgi:hypothetical protein